MHGMVSDKTFEKITYICFYSKEEMSALIRLNILPNEF
jgi:hypothetical protein